MTYTWWDVFGVAVIMYGAGLLSGIWYPRRGAGTTPTPRA